MSVENNLSDQNVFGIPFASGADGVEGTATDKCSTPFSTAEAIANREPPLLRVSGILQSHTASAFAAVLVLQLGSGTPNDGVCATVTLDGVEINLCGAKTDNDPPFDPGSVTNGVTVISFDSGSSSSPISTLLASSMASTMSGLVSGFGWAVSADVSNNLVFTKASTGSGATAVVTNNGDRFTVLSNTDGGSMTGAIAEVVLVAGVAGKTTKVISSGVQGNLNAGSSSLAYKLDDVYTPIVIPGNIFSADSALIPAAVNTDISVLLAGVEGADLVVRYENDPTGLDLGLSAAIWVISTQA